MSVRLQSSPVRSDRLETVHDELCTSECTVCTGHDTELATSANLADLMRCGRAPSADISNGLMHFGLSAERPMYSLAIWITLSCSSLV